MAGLAFKLGTLLLRQLSKPIANEFKRAATNSEAFSGFCVGTANAMNRFTTSVNLQFLGHKSKEVKPLAEAVAVAKGAEFLGEAIVFAIGGGVVVWEMSRQSAKSAKEKAAKAERHLEKEIARQAEFRKLQDELQSVVWRLDKLEAAFTTQQQQNNNSNNSNNKKK